MKIDNKHILLIVILLLAGFLRFYKLGSYPALNADEASIGYDAYSLLQTGRDQHGNLWPMTFQSFNDYKPGLIVYLVMPFIKIFGLSVFWLRFLPALLGVATVYIVNLLAIELFSYSKKLPITNGQSLGLAASALLATSPWHIHFSRGAWEVNIATFFLVLGVYLFMKSLRNYKLLTFCVIALVLSLYSYHSAIIVVPALMVGVLAIYREQLVFKNLKVFSFSLIVALILSLPLLYGYVSGNALKRAGGIGLTADPGITERTKEQQLEHFIDGGNSKYFARLIHNKYINYSLTFVKNWTEHFNGNFLFVTGDVIQRNKVPDMGQLYLWEIITVAVGLITLLISWTKEGRVIIHWLLIAPIASALTFQAPHALRSQNMVIPMVLISSLGLCFMFDKLRNLRIRKLVYLFIILIIVWNFSFYTHQYFVHMSKELPYSSQYGVGELVEYIKAESGEKEIVVSDRYDQPYVLFLFYLKYPPNKFQNNHVLTERDMYGFSTVREFDKFRFINLNWDQDKLKYPGSIIAAPSDLIPAEANIVKEVYGSNGIKYFNVVAN